MKVETLAEMIAKAHGEQVENVKEALRRGCKVSGRENIGATEVEFVVNAGVLKIAREQLAAETLAGAG